VNDRSATGRSETTRTLADKRPKNDKQQTHDIGQIEPEGQWILKKPLRCGGSGFDAAWGCRPKKKTENERNPHISTLHGPYALPSTGKTAADHLPLAWTEGMYCSRAGGRQGGCEGKGPENGRPMDLLVMKCRTSRSTWTLAEDDEI
jgi:hypothetical protein